MEKSLIRTVNREEEPCRSGMEAGLKDSFVVKETPLRNNNHQEEKIYKMKFQDSQQQNGTFLTIETSSCSSADLNECVVVEDENELSPIMEIDNQNEPRTCSGNRKFANMYTISTSESCYNTVFGSHVAL